MNYQRQLDYFKTTLRLQFNDS